MTKRLLIAASGLVLALAACAKEDAAHDMDEHAAHAPAGASDTAGEAASPAVEGSDPVFEAATVRIPVGGRDVSSARVTVRAGGEPVKIVGVQADFAETAELHVMVMDDDAMRMRRADAWEIPANTVLNPEDSGEHLMLFGVDAAALTAGETVEIRFDLEAEDGTISTQSVPFTVVGLD